MSLLSDITDFIASDASIEAAFGASIQTGVNLYVGFVPVSPANVITLFIMGGSPPEPGNKYKHNSHIQIRLRSTDFLTSYNTGQALIDQMHYNGNVLTNSNGILYAMQSSPIFVSRSDEDRRVIMTCNFEVSHVRY